MIPHTPRPTPYPQRPTPYPQRPTLYSLTLLLTLAACTAPPNTTDGRTPLRMSILLISTEQVAYYRWVEETFEARNPGVDVIIDQFPGNSLKDYEIKLRLQFASHRPPDVFHANLNVMAEMAALGLLAPTPDTLQAKMRENGLNAVVQEGACLVDGCYGVVSDAIWTALYYNKAHFRDAGLDPKQPPRTWDALVDYAERLTVRDADGRLQRTGLSLRKTGYRPGTAEKWLTFLYAAGGQPFSPDGTRTAFNSEAGRAALNLYKTILFDKRLDAVTLEGDQQGFGQGRVSMFIREVHVIRWLRANHPDLDFGVAPIPARDTSLSATGAYLFAVSTECPYQEAAWRFVDFLMSDEAYGRYASIGGILPVTRSVAAAYRSDPHLRVFLDQGVAPTQAFPRMGRALDILGAYIERFCYGHLTVDETLTRAAADIDALLARNAAP